MPRHLSTRPRSLLIRVTDGHDLFFLNINKFPRSVQRNASPLFFFSLFFLPSFCSLPTPFKNENKEQKPLNQVWIPNVDLKSEFEYIFIRIDAKEAVDGRESKQEDGYWNGKTKFPNKRALLAT
ncbi:hypothetical protein CCACVL1_29428 [Corchorus capsularis]|uniref:Uncharacterized protein n=1 Tax=Corchorus capsularis TaxID=210143 RepID=A0A1R3G1V2_COCAP|nr:hypothetical protein CCACVL1_29428 [Corchorus capsularis]